MNFQHIYCEIRNRIVIIDFRDDFSKKSIITKCLQGRKKESKYDGYYYKISDVIMIVILGSICGLKNVRQIHQLLKAQFGIIKPEFLNKCFAKCKG